MVLKIKILATPRCCCFKFCKKFSGRNEIVNTVTQPRTKCSLTEHYFVQIAMPKLLYKLVT